MAPSGFARGIISEPVLECLVPRYNTLKVKIIFPGNPSLDGGRTPSVLALQHASRAHCASRRVAWPSIDVSSTNFGGFGPGRYAPGQFFAALAMAAANRLEFKAFRVRQGSRFA
jgi:hypothetical protein